MSKRQQDLYNNDERYERRKNGCNSLPCAQGIVVSGAYDFYDSVNGKETGDLGP